jgi:hypothetical protein
MFPADGSRPCRSCERFVDVMRHATALNGSFFNTRQIDTKCDIFPTASTQAIGYTLCCFCIKQLFTKDALPCSG